MVPTGFPAFLKTGPVASRVDAVREAGAKAIEIVDVAKAGREFT